MRYLFLLAGLVLIFTSCNLTGNRVKGNGKIQTMTFDVKNFKSIDAGGAVHIILTQDSAFTVKAETDENLLKLLGISVDGNELNIGTKGSGNWLSPTDEIKIMVSMPFVKNIEIGGASEITSGNKFSQEEKIFVHLSGASEGTLEVRAPSVSLEASGASTLTISGETRDAVSDVSGASTINAFDLKSENHNVEASGASSADVFASIGLKVNASGASHVSYKGAPAIKQEVTGASDLTKAD